MNDQPHQRFRILRRVGWLLLVAPFIYGISALLPPAPPRVEFVRHMTEEGGRVTVVCRVTNRSLRPVGLFGNTPTHAMWEIQDPATGDSLQYPGCFSGAEFHGLAPSESREFRIPAPKTKAAQVRYGIIYGSPFEESAPFRESC